MNKTCVRSQSREDTDTLPPCGSVANAAPFNIHILTIITLPSPSAQDRLLYLDIAEDFLAKAKRFYPPKEDSDEDTPGLAINLPLLLARVEAINGAGVEEEENDSERDDGNMSDRS